MLNLLFFSNVLSENDLVRFLFNLICIFIIIIIIIIIIIFSF